jgi:hypothetical protein
VASEDSTHLVQSRLRCRVCVGLECRNSDSIDRTDVDDSSGIFPGTFRVGIGETLEHQRGELLSEGEDSFQVQPQDAVPRLVGVFVVRCSPVVARVVDEYVDIYRGVNRGGISSDSSSLFMSHAVT